MRKALAIGVLVLLVTALPAGAYDVYKYSQIGQPPDPVPDVNKLGGAQDNSCWLATAANMLAGAGWGLSDKTAQQNGDAIYGQLTGHFGTACGGMEERAINWWLLNYGYNPDAVDANYYRPTLTYNDVTHVDRTLTAADYDFLLNELTRCQYVGVSFVVPGQELGHAMTLVGGNYSSFHVPPGGLQASVWHDSDKTLGVNGDDPHANVWRNANNDWYVNYQDDGNPNNDLLAENYTTLCPGLQKPKSAIDNYDVAYYRDMAPDGSWFRTFREAGVKKDVFADPVWDDSFTLTLGNEIVQDYHKEVWLLIDYLDRDNNTDPNILLVTQQDPNGLSPTEIDYSPDNGQIRLHWVLDYQPAWEKIVFPLGKYCDLSGDVKDLNVATECIPEPATLALLALGGLAMLRRRK
ncbi:MAG: PEP-CTERM sorting domain-containing protein [Phycisphaerae bacterium]|jgi:hypothetical protein